MDCQYLDLFLVHWPYTYKVDEQGERQLDFIPRHEVWRKFEELVEEGIVKHIGLSNFNTALVYDCLCYSSIKPICN